MSAKLTNTTNDATQPDENLVANQTATIGDSVRNRIGSLLKKSFAGVLFIGLNCLIVVANITFPWILNKENIRIVRVDALQDEEEYLLPQIANSLLSGEVQRNPKLLGEINGNVCNSAIIKSIVSARCRPIVKSALNDILKSRNLSLDNRFEVVQRFENVTEEEFVNAFGDELATNSIRSVIIDALAQLSFGGDLIKEEYQPAWESRVRRYLQILVEEERRDLESVDQAVREISSLGSKSVLSGNVVFRVSVMNTGREAGFVHANAKLLVAGEEIALTTIRENNLAYPERRMDTSINPYDPGTAGILYYVIDPTKNSEAQKQRLARIFQQGSPIAYAIEIETTGGQVKADGFVNSDPVSLEDFPNYL